MGAVSALSALDIEWAVATRSRTGETRSGDQHLVERRGGLVLAAAIDGLGHGDEAANAAGRAVSVLADASDWRLQDLFQRCHVALVGTRGVVMSCAVLDLQRGSMTWAGIGNVEGVVMGPATDAKQTLTVRSGVIGYQVPTLGVATVPLGAGSLLVFSTDGIKAGFEVGLEFEESPEHNARRILEKHGSSIDDALALVLQVQDGRSHAGP